MDAIVSDSNSQKRDIGHKAAKIRAHGAAATEWQDYYDGRPGIRRRIPALKPGQEPVNRAERRSWFPARAGKRYR